MHPTLRYSSRSLEDVRYWVLHHVAVDSDPTPEQTARYHIDQHGWPGIGYHWVIMRDGTIYSTQLMTTMSYHVAGRNKEAVGILVNGDFRQGRQPTAQQIDAVLHLLGWLDQLYPGRQVVGHGEIALAGWETECPGDLMASIRPLL